MENPHIEDYQAYLAEWDIAFSYTLCRLVHGLYFTYTIIHDLVSKDIEKILHPRDGDDNILESKIV